MSERVVDHKQIERYYSNSDLQELYSFNPHNKDHRTFHIPNDEILHKILLKHQDLVYDCMNMKAC